MINNTEINKSCALPLPMHGEVTSPESEDLLKSSTFLKLLVLPFKMCELVEPK